MQHPGAAKQSLEAPRRTYSPFQHLKGLQRAGEGLWTQIWSERTRGNGFTLTEGGLCECDSMVDIKINSLHCGKNTTEARLPNFSFSSHRSLKKSGDLWLDAYLHK